MNIKEAKVQIKEAITAYFTKNQYGHYIIPIEKQRPIFLIGAPGIGKTAIMEQISKELNVGLVSYSMTHHTRQSALGLPFITDQQYENENYKVSEYTMSEIIASIYDYMKNTGKKEGILFLDEINCVSETLMPSMLQFLQYKIFGRHRIPEGWIVVTAGNPPEYNASVKEFDVVTMDRLKKIEVVPHYKSFKEYALENNIHPAITTYLENKKDNFYKVETTLAGKAFATPRGWEDLSQMIRLYEQHEFKVSIDLINQYIQHKPIAKDFSLYYDLFCKYQSDYQIEEILNNHASSEIKLRAKHARFDEKIALIGLLNDSLTKKIKDILEVQDSMIQLLNDLKIIKNELNNNSYVSTINKHIQSYNDQIIQAKKFNTLSQSQINQLSYIVDFYDRNLNNNNFDDLKVSFNDAVIDLKQKTQSISNQLNSLFIFMEEVYGKGQELSILVTELTINQYTAKYISQYGCDKYFEHNKDLMFYERNKELLKQIDELNIV